MAVITISREFGCGGTRIAEEAAGRLGYHFIDKKMIGKILAAYGLIEFDKEYESEVGFWASYDTKLRETVSMLNRVVKSLARHGDVVILGRGAFAVLGGFVDVLNVRLQAPIESRITRVMAEMELTDRGKAAEMLEDGDRVRTSFVHTMYGIHLDACSAFNLMIDTSKVAPEMATSWIVEAARGLGAGAKGPRSSDIKADLTLDETVADELACRLAHA